MTIWKQGPFYPDLGKNVVELPNEVHPGPSDAMIKIDGFNVQPDENGDFIHGSNGVAYAEDELDAINTYAIVRMVINLYEDLLGKPIQWSWWENGKGDPLLIKIRNNDINARFIKEYKCIELDYYGPYKNWTYNCRSADLIAHETGHAILDSILPQFNNGSTETRGIGEAFCDLSAMFWVLSQKDLCEHVIKENGGDLTKESILTLFGVGYGYSQNKYKELRSAINCKKYSINSKVSYDYCQVLVCVLYQLLVLLFTDNLSEFINNSDRLYQSGKEWMRNIVAVFLKNSNSNVTLPIFIKNVVKEFQGGGREIEKHFSRNKFY